MHNVVQNYMSSSIPYKSEMTKIEEQVGFFSAMTNFSIRLFLTLSKLVISPNYPYLGQIFT